MTRSLMAALAAFLCIAGSSVARAEFDPLTSVQLKALFEGGFQFSSNPRRSNIQFDFRPDGRWWGEPPSGDELTGSWELDGNKLCVEMHGPEYGWDNLRDMMGCSWVIVEGEILIWAGTGFAMYPEDSSVIARVKSLGPEREADRLAAERERIEQEKRKLEEMRLALQQQNVSRQRVTAPAAMQPPSAPAVEFGAFHALVIGINDYKSLPKLKTAILDARAIATALKEQYGYTVRILENASRSDIIDALDDYRDTLEEADNLLIYYAGHGWLDKESGRGYWLPVAAKADRRSNWFSNASLTDALNALHAKHVMVVADSCYSGTLTRSIEEKPERDDGYFARMAKKRARVVLSSGGLEPVVDSGGGQHSVFAAQFLKALAENNSVMDGTGLFETVRRSVVLNARQTPQYSDIRMAGHEGGDFLFVRRK